MTCRRFIWTAACAVILTASFAPSAQSAPKPAKGSGRKAPAAPNAVPAPTPPPPAPTIELVLPPGEAFEKGENAFGRGDYPGAIRLLRPLLYPQILVDSEGQVVQAHRMLGVAHLFENQPEPAREEFERLLELRPDYRFDPLLDPPQVVDFFNKILKGKEGEIAALQARRREAERAEEEQRRRLLELNQPRVIERQFIRNSYLVNFIPFGAGQFQNGQRKKGWAFLATESALALASVAAFTTNFALFGVKHPRACLEDRPEGCPAGPFDRSDEDFSNRLRDIQLLTGGLFYAVAAWGIVDAVMNFRPVSPGGTIQVEGSQAGVKPVLIPMVLGGTVGPGMAARF